MPLQAKKKSATWSLHARSAGSTGSINTSGWFVRTSNPFSWMMRPGAILPCAQTISDRRPVGGGDQILSTCILELALRGRPLVTYPSCQCFAFAILLTRNARLMKLESWGTACEFVRLWGGGEGSNYICRAVRHGSWLERSTQPTLTPTRLPAVLSAQCSSLSLHQARSPTTTPCSPFL